MRERSSIPVRERTVITRSEAETEAFGRELARALRVPGVVLLRGALGAGKTTLTRGIAEGLGVTDPSAVSSPSFTLVNSYQGWCRIYHVDLYRLEGERDFYSTGLEDFLGIDGITIIEWSERLNFPVTGAVTVNIRDLGGESREITVSKPVGGRRHGRTPAATGRRASTRWRRK